MFWLKVSVSVTRQKYLVYVTTNFVGNRPKVSIEISSGVTLWNIETQTQTVVTGLAA